MTVIFGDHSLKVSFEIDSTKVKTDDLLEEVWAGMNRGSCHEFPWFLGIKSRSLSVGDFIMIGEDSPHDVILYQVTSFGFNRVSRKRMETFMSEVKTLMDAGNPPWHSLCETVWKYKQIDA